MTICHLRKQDMRVECKRHVVPIVERSSEERSQEGGSGDGAEVYEVGDL